MLISLSFYHETIHPDSSKPHKYRHTVIFMPQNLQMKPDIFGPEDSTQNLKNIIPPKPWQRTQKKDYYNNICSGLRASVHDATLP